MALVLWTLQPACSCSVGGAQVGGGKGGDDSGAPSGDSGDSTDIVDTGDSGDSGDSGGATGDTGSQDTGVDTGDPVRVCGFETGELSGFQHPGVTWAASDDGGIAALFEQGEDFSGLLGEEDIEFFGQYALVIRSNDDGDTDTWGSITTNPFVPQTPSFTIQQISEVDERGVELELQILDVQGELLHAEQLPVESGGHVPGLAEGQEPIEGFPEIQLGSQQAGSFVLTVADLSAWYEAGETIQVRVRQRTLVQGVGFFTLLDDLCNEEP